MSTHVTKLTETELGRRHYIVDADGQVLGRLAYRVAAGPGGAAVLDGASRVTCWGALARALTAGVGALFGVAA